MWKDADIYVTVNTKTTFYFKHVLIQFYVHFIYIVIWDNSVPERVSQVQPEERAANIKQEEFAQLNSKYSQNS